MASTLESRISSLEQAIGTEHNSIAVLYDDDPAPEDGAPFVRVAFVDAPSRDDAFTARAAAAGFKNES